jgi:hypothetical protein
MFVEARNPFLLPVESQRDGMFQADFAYGAYASNMPFLRNFQGTFRSTDTPTLHHSNTPSLFLIYD